MSGSTIDDGRPAQLIAMLPSDDVQECLSWIIDTPAMFDIYEREPLEAIVRLWHERQLLVVQEGL